MSQNRFKITLEEKIPGSWGLSSVRIMVDKLTGVNYIQTTGESSCGLTPLLDPEGKVVVTPMFDEK